MIELGFVKVHRAILTSHVFQNEGLLKVWLWCLLKANHSETWEATKIGRGTTEVKISRGQFIFGREKASKELRMKPSTVWKRILKLENMRNLNIQSNSKYSVISIVNWNTYQDRKEKSNSESNNQGTAKEHRQECKEVNTIYKGIFEHWNSKGIIQHRDFEKFEKYIKAKIEPLNGNQGYSAEEIMQAISNYAEILNGPEYFFSYRWGLDEFFSRKGGLDKFLSINEPHKNFLRFGKKKDSNPEKKSLTLAEYEKLSDEERNRL